VTNAPDWARVNELFHQALELAPDRRAAFLTQECGEDRALREEVSSLLASHEEDVEFLERPAVASRAPDVDVTPAPIGHTIGHYRIVRVLGQGGMGVVYLADDTRLGRAVALKALPPHLTADPVRRERLRREARAAAALTHPGIATVYALEEFDDQVYIAGEYVPGETLRDELARGPLPASRVIDTALGLAHALAAAHDRGVVHRDLKPENVIRTTSGDVKILDFGLARMRDAVPVGPETGAGVVIGTPAYMSPEQIRSDAVDFRSDLFSLGVMLYELATGVHPFAGSNPASTIARILEAQPSRLTSRVSLPLSSAGGLNDLDAIVTTCLNKAPDARYRSTHELIGALERARGMPSFATPSPVSSTLPAPAPVRHAVWWWQLHQAIASVAYAAMLVPLWLARAWTPGLPGTGLFLAGLAAVLVASTLRLHLWFTVRELPAESAAQRGRAGRWIRLADALFVVVFAVAGALALDRHATMAALFVSAAIAALVSFTFIEPATARAAFGIAGSSID
jgi:serine/threonine protein kinase